MTTSAASRFDRGLVGFFGCESAGEAAADDVAAGPASISRDVAKMGSCFPAPEVPKFDDPLTLYVARTSGGSAYVRLDVLRVPVGERNTQQ